MRVILAQPRGFCAGVVRAIEIVERALEKYGPPVYVRHEIVHNKYVVESLKAKGARFVESLKDVPPGAVTVFSAHGVSKEVEREAAGRNLPVLDATCPLVTKVHNQGKRYIAQGRTLILIGHAGHPEVEGTMGQVPGPVHLVQSESEVDSLKIPVDVPVAYVTQTTLSVDDTRGIIAALKRRCPAARKPSSSACRPSSPPFDCLDETAKPKKEATLGIPLRQKAFVGAYVVRQHLMGRKRYPLVLMLEPLFRCNLACAGCGKI